MSISKALCTLCENLDFETFFKGLYRVSPDRKRLINLGSRSLPHHPSLKALKETAAKGCGLCAIFYHGWIDQYERLRSSRVNVTREETLKHLESLDAEVSEGFWLTNFGGKRIEVMYGCKLFSGFIDFYVEVWTLNWEAAFSSGRFWGRVIRELPDFEEALEWIHECSEKHTRRGCNSIKDLPLPTRLISVGNGTSSLRLEETNGKKGQYVTLSHCWGTSPPLTTNVWNYETHLQNIAFENLPKLFQDAVTIVRRLGFQFLWIDSLCIKQGDKEDWEKECARMADVFANAALCIANPHATSSSDRMLHSRQTLKPRPTLLPWKTNGHDVIFRIEEGYYFLRGEDALSNTPLSKRGWVLQERLLSPRILYFGPEQMHFECHIATYCESSWYPVGMITEGHSTGLTSGKSILRRHNQHNIWQDIVRAFSWCDISHRTDKLPALSGIARQIQQRFNDVYLAGIWQSDIAKGLAWTRAGWVDVKAKHPQPIAPTWSWASLDQPIKFRFDLQETKALRLLQADIQPNGHDALGEVKYGRLLVEGKVVLTTVAHRESKPEDFGAIPLLQDNLTICECLPDYHPPPQPGDEIRCLLLGLEDNKRHDWVALALRPSHRSGHFQRLGLCHIVRFGPHGIPDAGVNWDNIQPQKIILV